MSTSATFDTRMDRVAAGERLSSDEIRELATTPDILALGMLADALRRRLHNTRATFLRVEDRAFDAPGDSAVPDKAREIRLTGSPAQLSDAVRSIAAAKGSGDRTVSGLSWSDVERFAAGSRVPDVLASLRSAGLDSVAVLPLDAVEDPQSAIEHLMSAGFTKIRLTIDKAAAADRASLLIRAGELQDRYSCIHALNPLPMSLSAFKPTTGYDDVKMVAIARLAAPAIPTIQVDWRRYGPKLAQVALSFGADDIDGISSSDEAPEGRRRAPLEEIKRNIEAAGFEAVERTGLFTPIV